MQILKPGLKVCLVVRPHHAIHARRGFAFERVALSGAKHSVLPGQYIGRYFSRFEPARPEVLR